MKHLDLFSGIGGFALAAQWADLDTVAFCEINPWCVDNALSKNWPDIPVFTDVRKLYRFAMDCIPCPDCDEPFCELCEAHFHECDCTGCSEFDDDIGNIDLITAGVPCQPASIIGKRGGSNDSRWLWPDTLRLVEQLEPTWFVGENPIGLLTLDGGERFGEILQRFQQAGYDVWWETLPATAAGAGHRRERVWIVAHARRAGLEGHTGNGERVDGQVRQKTATPRPITPQIIFPVRDNPDWWKNQCCVPIVVNGIRDYAHWKEGVIATGNAIVPQVAFAILNNLRLVGVQP